jgi:hypothetical protein
VVELLLRLLMYDDVVRYRERTPETTLYPIQSAVNPAPPLHLFLFANVNVLALCPGNLSTTGTEMPLQTKPFPTNFASLSKGLVPSA